MNNKYILSALIEVFSYVNFKQLSLKSIEQLCNHIYYIIAHIGIISSFQTMSLMTGQGFIFYSLYTMSNKICFKM